MVTPFIEAINVWLIWILPFAGAAIIPAIAKGKKNARNYIAVDRKSVV